MAENYGLNSKFGFNVLPKNREIQQLNGSSSNGSGSLFDFMSDSEKYDSVINGDVERETNMYIRQSMIVGMNLRAATPKRTFDVNI